MKTLDKVLVIVGSFVALFVVANMVTFWIFQSVPDALIYATLGTGGGELILTCIITCVKKKLRIKDDTD